jgi:dsRNA-specific ribonuclease
LNISIDAIERRLGYVFGEKGLLLEALTHGAYTSENPEWSHASNRRLEFFGDAIVRLFATKALLQMFPEARIKKLDKIRSVLVSNKVFVEVGVRLGLHEYMYVPHSLLGVRRGGGGYTIANCFEAIMAAIYMDGGEVAANRFLSTHLFPLIPKIVATLSTPNPQSLSAKEPEETAVDTLLGKCLRRYALAPRYSEVPATATDKGPVTIVVLLNEEKIGEGIGQTRQQACVKAAENALIHFPPS